MTAVRVPYLLVVVDGPSEARGAEGSEGGGAVRKIVRQVFGEVVAQSIEIRYWRHIRLSGKRKARGHVEKAHVVARDGSESAIYGALLLLDGDGAGDARLSDLREGVERSGARERAAVGVAREMIEAWLLADPALVALPLPAGKSPEDLWGERDAWTSNYPKHVLRRCVLDPRGWSHAEAVEAFDPSRARAHARSLHAFMAEVEDLADRHYAR